MFALLLVAGVHLFGIAGAALAWSLRVLLDTALLFAMAWRLHPPQRTVLARGAGLLCSATGALLLTIYAVHGSIQIALTVIITVACAFAALHTLRLTRLGTHKGIPT